MSRRFLGEERNEGYSRSKRIGCLGAQSVKCPTVDFGSGPDLRVISWSPVWDSILSAESA